LIFEFWELLVEAQDCLVVFLGGGFIGDIGEWAFGKTCTCWSLKIEDIGLAIPVVGVVSEVF
jgi:hypothetical protein